MITKRQAPEFFDDDEKELIESFESSLENGEHAAPSDEARAQMTADWQVALANTAHRA